MPNLDEATYDSLTQKHGTNLETIELDYVDGPIVIKPPSSADWRLFRDDTSGVPVDDRVHHLAQKCVVFPELETLNRIAEERPAMFAVIGAQVVALAGFQGEVKRKKLQRPNATPK